MTRLFLSLLLTLAIMPAMALAQGASDDFLSADEAFSHDVAANDDGTLTVTWTIVPDYYLYRHQFDFQGQPAPVADVSLPEGEPITDEFFGDSEVYHNQVAATIDPGEAKTIKLSWQGCAEAGLCYPPQHATIDTTKLAGIADNSGTDTGASTSAGSLAEDQSLAMRLAGSNTAWVLLVFFGLGLLLVFTPCVLPMLPILTSLIVGSGARGGRGFALSLAYVLAMAVVYAGLGVAAALAGANLGAWLQTPVILGLFAALFVALALSMFGLYELQLPGPIRDRLQQVSARQHGGSLGGAAVMGALSAVIVGPCMTAPLAGALLYIADTGNAVVGGSALFTLGLGMGAPLVAVGSLGAHLLPRSGPWMNGVKVIFGFVLLAMALWFVARVMPSPWTVAGTGALTLAVGVTLFQVAVRADAPLHPAAMIARVAGLVVGLWGSVLIVGGATGSHSLSQPLAFVATPTTQTAGEPSAADPDDFMARFDDVADLDTLTARIDRARANGRWTLVDFYADWCVSCKVIETQVFGDTEVQSELADVQLLRPDVTANDADDRELMRAFNVAGPPTLLLIGPDGEERRAARVVGELDAEAFLQHWARAQATGSPS